MRITVTIPGEPVGKGRPKFTRNDHAYTPEKTRDYEEKIALLYRAAARGYKFAAHVPVDVRIRAYFAIPASDSRRQRNRKLTGEIRPCKTPDTDNIAKAVLDSINKIAYVDDAQVVDIQVRKFYSDNPRVEILVQEAQTKKEEKHHE